MQMETTTNRRVNPEMLERKVKAMYRDVALNPNGTYHFETGRGLALKLGYEPADLDRLPEGSVESFAGVGYFADIANFQAGEAVLDLGSGSGMDSFLAALKLGPAGHVTGVDITDEQLEKAERLRKEFGFGNVSFVKSHIETLPFADASFDLVISNGVINLSPEKEAAFAEVARILKPGGRMAFADIVSEKQMPESIVCNSTLWASCIGGAAQQDSYREAIEQNGLKVLYVRNNDAYGFISRSAINASRDYGVKSVSMLIEKPLVQ